MGVSKHLLRALWSRLAPRSFLRFAAASPHELGLAGEELAARYLRSRGWRLLGRRLRTVHGEVDLWAWHAGVSWVVEIKTRRLHEHFTAPAGREPLAWSRGGVPTLRAAQRERLARAARSLARRGAGRPAVALLEVLVSRDSRRVELRGPMEVPWDLGPPPAASRWRQLGP